MSEALAKPSEMVERVAIALSQADPDSRALPDWTDMASFYRGLARAAIEAMREPTSTMNRAGCRAIPAGHGQAWIHAPDAYSAMIDAALSAGERG
jgi:hypothetical protein